MFPRTLKNHKTLDCHFEAQNVFFVIHYNISKLYIRNYHILGTAAN